MANTNDHDSAVQWSATGSVTMSNNTTIYASDAVPINANAVAGAIQVTADNAGTPATGDVAELWIAWSVDGTTFDTEEHGQPLRTLDTVAANFPGEDPARATYPLHVMGKQAFKLLSRGPQSASRNIVISAAYNETRRT